MDTIFVSAVVFVFLTIFIESIHLILQLKGRKLTKWFGKNAFKIHMISTIFFWSVTFFLIIILQFEKHPFFHNSSILKCIGLVLLACGIVMGGWAFKLLGLKRSLCLNFFEENVPIVKHPLYEYVKNPEDYGFLTILFGFALFTRSFYNLIIAIEFMVLLIPHMKLENKPIKK